MDYANSMEDIKNNSERRAPKKNRTILMNVVQFTSKRSFHNFVLLLKQYWKKPLRQSNQNEKHTPTSLRKALQFINSTSVSKSLNDINVKNNNAVVGREIPQWQQQKIALKKKFKGDKWNPSKKLSRESMESIKMLKRQFPHMNASELGERFKVSPEAIRRILKASWTPNEQEAIDINKRWKLRGERIKDLYTSSSANGTVRSNGKDLSDHSSFVVMKYSQNEPATKYRLVERNPNNQNKANRYSKSSYFASNNRSKGDKSRNKFQLLSKLNSKQ